MYRTEAIVKDGAVTEVLATPIGVTFERTDDDRTLMVLDVRDVNGDKHQVTTTERAHMHRLVRMAGYTEPGFLPKVVGGYSGSSPGRYQKQVLKAFDERSPVLFRLNPDNSVYALMSDQWRRNEIEQVIPLIQAALDGVEHEMVVTPSDGYYGGKADITLAALNEIATPRISVSMGPKDGCHAFKVVSSVTILFCSNQLTLEVGRALGSMVDTRFTHYLAEQHRAKVMSEEFLTEAMSEAVGAAGGIIELVERSKKVRVKPDQVERLMRYYEANRRVSAQSAATIRTLFGIGEVAQVPGTLYGLAMAVSYYGTHHLDLSEVVRSSVNTMAGEMLVVSPHSKEYFDVVDGYCKVLDEREAAAAEA